MANAPIVSRPSSSASTFRLVGAALSGVSKCAAVQPLEIATSGKPPRTARTESIQQLLHACPELLEESSDAETVSTASPDDRFDDSASFSSFDVSTRCSVDEIMQLRAGCPRARYREKKVENWFRDIIDTSGQGAVYMRHFLAALREQGELQAVLCDVAGVRFTAHERQEHARLKVVGALGLSVQERTEILLAERHRVREVFRACARDDGLLDLGSFIGFFHARGALLN